MSFTVLTIPPNATSGVSRELPLPTWSGPDPPSLRFNRIQSTFIFLASAFLAAFLASLGRQCPKFHLEGAFIDHNRHRELEMMDTITWRFKFVEHLPLTIQVSPSWGTHGSGIPRTSVVQSPPSSPDLRPLASPSISSSSPSGRFRRSFQSHPKILWSYTVASITAKTHRFIAYRKQIPIPPIASDGDDQDNEVHSELSYISTMFKMSKVPDSIW